MLAETADKENAFHGTNMVLLSSTVSPAAIPRRARRAKEVPPSRQPSTQLLGSYPSPIRTLAESKNGCLLDATRIVPFGNDALDRPYLLIGLRNILIVPIPTSPKNGSRTEFGTISGLCAPTSALCVPFVPICHPLICRRLFGRH